MKLKTENKEIIAGTVLVVLLGGLLGFVHAKSAVENDARAFYLYAPFSKADGLMNGADVRIAGIKVGEVEGQKLGNGYQVLVKLGFDKKIELSVDTSVVIETDGLLGSKYLEIVPGADEEMLESGDEIAYTQDAVILTELMDKVNAYMREKKQVKEEEITEANEPLSAIQPETGLADGQQTVNEINETNEGIK